MYVTFFQTCQPVTIFFGELVSNYQDITSNTGYEYQKYKNSSV